MTTIDDKIRRVRLELENIRRVRWENEKNFYAESEELNCEISLLRWQITALLDSGDDLNVVRSCLEESCREENYPYVGLHFGHQVLLLSAIHQMEARKSFLKLIANQGKEMATYLEKMKLSIEEEYTSLGLELVNNFSAQADLYVVDDRLAQTVVAQRLVIRKLVTLVGECERDDCTDNLVADGTTIEVPIVTRACCDAFLDESCLTLDFSEEESPKNVRSFFNMSKMEDEIDAIELECMNEINSEFNQSWGLLRRSWAA